MLSTTLGYLVLYVENLVKDLKAVVEPPPIIPILALALLKQIDVTQFISLFLLFFSVIWWYPSSIWTSLPNLLLSPAKSVIIWLNNCLMSVICPHSINTDIAWHKTFMTVWGLNHVMPRWIWQWLHAALFQQNNWL